jgi:hypothetical protein
VLSDDDGGEEMSLGDDGSGIEEGNAEVAMLGI